ADRVARRRRRGHPRHEHAAAPRPGRLARLRARLEPDRCGAPAAGAARHADLDHGVTAASVRRASSPSAARNEPLRPLRALRVDALVIEVPPESCCQAPPGARAIETWWKR